jgi:chromosome segregation ATPase
MDRTNAERQRRYITRLKAAAAQKPAQHEAAAERIAALEVENAALKAEVARLKAAAADTQQRQSRERPRTDWAALKAQATAARKAKRAEAKAARLAAAAAERPDADVPTLLAENDTLQRQLKAARTEIKNLKAELRYFTNLRGTIFTPDLEKKIRVCLHPDWVTDPKQQRRYNETLAEFNAVIDATKKQRRS